MYGDGEKFEEAWKKHSDELYRFILYSVRDPADAADLLHDVAVKGIENWHRLKDKSAARAWLYQIARNQIRDYYRKRRPVLLETESVIALIDKYAAMDIDRSAAMEFLASLPPPWASVIILHLHYGYTIQEVAGMLGMSRWTIGKHMPRLIKMLASAIYLPDEVDYE